MTTLADYGVGQSSLDRMLAMPTSSLVQPLSVGKFDKSIEDVFAPATGDAGIASTGSMLSWLHKRTPGQLL